MLVEAVKRNGRGSAHRRKNARELIRWINTHFDRLRAGDAPHLYRGAEVSYAPGAKVRIIWPGAGVGPDIEDILTIDQAFSLYVRLQRGDLVTAQNFWWKGTTP